jgi:hypothetical protein
MPHGPLVLELSKKSRSYFLAGGYVRATRATVKSHDARNTKNSVRKLYAISRTRHGVMNTHERYSFTLHLQENEKLLRFDEELHVHGAQSFNEQSVNLQRNSVT